MEKAPILGYIYTVSYTVTHVGRKCVGTARGYGNPKLTQNRVPSGVGVQVPPGAPFFI